MSDKLREAVLAWLEERGIGGEHLDEWSDQDVINCMDEAGYSYDAVAQDFVRDGCSFWGGESEVQP